MSPKESKSIDTTEWPKWMTDEDNNPLWLEMRMPPNRRKVTRCDADGRPQAKPSSGGGFFNGSLIASRK